jgi:ABC-2 type transport system ATP-binding protein
MLQARDLVKTYGKKVAVDHLSFDVEPGRVTGFLGPNGSGKSTTMRLLLGLDRPTSGQALVAGRPYAELRNPLHDVGAVLEAKQVHPGRTGRNHLRWVAAYNRIPRRRVEEVLALVGMTDAAHRRAGQYSLGMLQRLGIAGALLGDPGILLFDEPVNGLDPDGIVWIRTMMKSLAAQGRTIFVSSHLLSEMSLTADHLVVIGRGRLITQTSTQDFIRSSSLNRTRVRSPHLDRLVTVVREAGMTAEQDADGALLVDGVETDAVGELAARNGITLHELSPQRASLEEAFMELTKDAVEYAGESQ